MSIGLPPGECRLKIKLYLPQAKRNVKLLLQAEPLERHGFYAIGTATVVAPAE